MKQSFYLSIVLFFMSIYSSIAHSSAPWNPRSLVDFCIMNHSYGFGTPYCNKILTPNKTSQNIDVYYPGSIQTGEVVSSITLYRGNNQTGESCKVKGNNFNGFCNGSDWRWQAQSVTIDFKSCQLYDNSLNLAGHVIPSTINYPVALGSCSTSTTPDYLVYKSSGLTHSSSNNYIPSLKSVCVIVERTPLTYVDLNTNSVNTIEVPSSAACLYANIP